MHLLVDSGVCKHSRQNHRICCQFRIFLKGKMKIYINLSKSLLFYSRSTP